MKNHDRTIQLLLVEDDDLSREVLTLQIAAEGYGVNSVDSGDAALRYLQQTPKPLLDVVLTDLQMPGVSGPELARQLRLAAIAAGSPSESAETFPMVSNVTFAFCGRLPLMMS